MIKIKCYYATFLSNKPITQFHVNSWNKITHSQKHYVHKLFYMHYNNCCSKTTERVINEILLCLQYSVCTICLRYCMFGLHPVHVELKDQRNRVGWNGPNLTFGLISQNFLRTVNLLFCYIKKYKYKYKHWIILYCLMLRLHAQAHTGKKYCHTHRICLQFNIVSSLYRNWILLFYTLIFCQQWYTCISMLLQFIYTRGWFES